MNISPFEQTKKDNHDGSIEGEAVRLSNELRAKQAYTEIDYSGKRVDHPAKSGFDIETCDIMDIKNWLNGNAKKSQSLLMFVHRVMAVRFPTEYARLKGVIDNRFKTEMDMVEGEAANDVLFFGKVGHQNMVRLDGSLTNVNVRISNLSNNRVKIVRK